MSDAVIAYMRALREVKAQCVACLRDGNPNAGAEARAAFPDLTFPEDIIALWRTFDGVAPPRNAQLGDVWFDGMFYLTSEAEAVEDYRVALSAQEQAGFGDYWPVGFFPIGTPGDGSRLLVNCIPGSPTHGALYELIEAEGLVRYASSLTRYFETLLACLDEGALRVNFHGQVDPDFERMREIAHEMNPGCDAWDDDMTPAHESKDWQH